MIAGCYTLHLYCDNYDPCNLGKHSFDEFPHEFTHELGSTCRRIAKERGWKVNYTTGSALCPKCAKRKS